MEKKIQKTYGFLCAAFFSLIAVFSLNSCKKNINLNGDVTKQNFTEVNLVSSSTSFAGARVDPNLINGWGMAISPTGTIWISAADAGKTVIYDQAGVEKLPAVSIPGPAGAASGGPTGQVFNSSTDFVLSNGNPAKFLFAGEDGVISGWNGGTSALVAVDNSSSSVYLGLAIGNSGGQNYLYAADFKNDKVDVFDGSFNLTSISLIDPNAISGYAPFNIQNVGGVLFVMYAKVDAETGEEEKGAGNGYVDEYQLDGTFIKRFATGDALNAPWGVALAPSTFMNDVGQVVLIGNFGDGRINAYDMAGNFIGALRSNGEPVEVDGLWGISFAPSTATTVDPNRLFFAAGPSDESQGLFGYITNQ